MIRIRTAEGEIIPLPSNAAVVEICSTDGRIGRIVIPGKDGRITLFEPDDEEFQAYIRAVKAEPATIIPIYK